MLKAIHYKFPDIGVGVGGIDCYCCSPGRAALKKTINTDWRNTEYKQIKEQLEDMEEDSRDPNIFFPAAPKEVGEENTGPVF